VAKKEEGYIMSSAHQKEVKLGLLGGGFVADFYMQGLKDVPGQEVVIVCSKRQDHPEVFAKEWKIKEWTDNLDKVIARDDLDLLIIALPNFLHKEVVIKLAKVGKNMVCAKPLGRDKQEAEEMLDAVNKAGVFNGYAETEVFSPAVVKAKEIILRGGIGKVTWVRSREAHGGPHSAHFWDQELSGGGALLDMGCHCIEAARYFFGKEMKPVETFCWGDTLVHKEKTKAEDNALLVVKFENGSIAQAEVSWSSHGGLDLRNEIYGTEGAIFTDVTRSTPIKAFTLASSGYIVEKAETEKGWITPLPEEAFTYGYQAEMKHFVECVRDGKEPRETFEDGYIVNAILDAGYKSMKTGRWEKIEY
jgi:predicted dehydrogenase